MKTREFTRLDRVQSTIQKVLAGPISEMARAANAGLATITHVEVSSDLCYATLYLSVYGGTTDRVEFARQVAENAFELQRSLGRELRTRRTPVLTIKLDDGIERGDRINRLLGDGSVAPAGD